MLHKHLLTDNAIIHNKKPFLQTKSFTQILKIEKNCNISNLQKKSEKEKETNKCKP
jgi:hypothetical protein